MRKHHPLIDIGQISNFRYAHTVLWALIMSLAVVAITAGLGRAALNLKASLTEKPDLAVYVLLPDKEIGRSTLLREYPDERDYLAESKDGPLFVKLRKNKQTGRWYVAETESLKPSS